MNEQEPVALQALIEEKLSEDTEFQSSLEGMSDEDKAKAVALKSLEVANEVYTQSVEYGKNQKLRAEKAEGKKAPEPKKETPEEPPKKPDTDEYQLTYKDNYALNEAKVHVDDVDEVIRFAKFNNVPVADALKDPILQGVLTQRTENRTSAQAANKGGGKASTKAPTSTEVLNKAREGKMPEPGTPEAEALYKARRGL